MAVTYEEALATLTSMFGSESGSKWTTDSLDQVLRHHQGHMENTVETVLQHGDGSPEVLLKRLRDPESVVAIDADEEIARQLAQSSLTGGSSMDRGLSQATKDFSLPAVTLPTDFLRIPGYKHRETAVNEQGFTDEQLAMMLQEQDLQEQLRLNPEFAHLARQNRNQSNARAAGYPGSTRGASVDEGPNIMEQLSKMGENAKQKLSLFASQINANLQKMDRNNNSSNRNQSRNETRGLLDGNDVEEEELLFAVSHDPNEMEMHTMTSTSSWGSNKNQKKNA